jgi:hypothetical protein
MGIYLLPRTPPGPDPIEPSCSRFGDWREPFCLPPAIDAVGLVTAAQVQAVDVHLAATVALEAQLLIDSAASLGIDPLEAAAMLDLAAVTAEPLAALNGKRYRRALLGRGAISDERLDGSISLPTRLHRRAATADVTAAFTAERMDQGIRWELAALADGRFIEDWGLLVLARAER